MKLIIEGDCVFTGDLSPVETADGWDNPSIAASWKSILSYGVRMIYPAHGVSYAINKQYIKI